MKKILLVCSALLFSLNACQTTSERKAQAEATILTAALAQNTFANESKDWNVAAKSEIRTGQYHSPTPTTIPQGKIITTGQLLKLIQSDPKAILIDVLGGNAHDTIPKAIWLKGAGLGKSFEDDLQQRLLGKLSTLTKGNKDTSIVYFCLSSECWLSYNAALRSTKLGYKNTYWYRGGLEAWKASGLPMAPSN